MKDRLETRRLAKNTDTQAEYVSEFTILWRLVEAFETDADDDWKTEGEKCYVFTKNGNCFCLLGNYHAFIAEWDTWRAANTYQLN